MVELWWFNPETRKQRRAELCANLEHAKEKYDERISVHEWPIGAEVYAYDRVTKVWWSLDEDEGEWYVFPQGLKVNDRHRNLRS